MGISNFATADEYSGSTLRVITIEKRQYGDYVCKAVNKLGQAGQGESVRNFYTYFDDAENPAGTLLATIGFLAAILYIR
uniref:Immunoglobulin I-set domain-containing protein n=1 Tax=Glossina brevipalpis TaxID=37001 RepID=A0A1A9WSU0_9MUSC